ncbi:MAG: tyrosine-type recombinase/integrase [Actinomycetota bacterium]|nr:tyrosine-type recombinase/integrase [Actinomycetota bacterium]
MRQNHVLGEFGTPKSKRSTRSVPMADEVAGELERLFQQAARQADDDLVFADPITGGPLSKAADNRRFRKALKAARLDPARRIHDLRHTFGTRCAAAGVRSRPYGWCRSGSDGTCLKEVPATAALMIVGVLTLRRKEAGDGRSGQDDDRGGRQEGAAR